MNDIVFNWNSQKNKILKENRGISFEEIVAAIDEGGLIDIISNPSTSYIHQKCLVVKVKKYIYSVPCIENEKEIFLKTIYPSRKFKKFYEKK